MRCVVDDIDEVGIVGLFDGGRNGEATHAKGADIGGNEGGTDGAIGGDGVGFDVDGDFHGDRCYSLYVLMYFRAIVEVGARG